MRLLEGAIVVGHKVHRALVNFVEKQTGNLGQTSFGVTHSRRAVSISAAEITLAQHKGIAHIKVLRHANHGVISSGIAVRVEFT